MTGLEFNLHFFGSSAKIVSCLMFQFIRTTDYFSTVFFTVEMVLKIIARGFYRHKNGYIRSNWNRLDFFIVLVSLLDLFLGKLVVLYCSSCQSQSFCGINADSSFGWCVAVYCIVLTC